MALVFPWRRYHFVYWLSFFCLLINLGTRVASATPNQRWQEFDSTRTKHTAIWTTDDWDNFSLVNGVQSQSSERPSRATFQYPQGWNFDGHHVFMSSSDWKIAELSPGVIQLGVGQSCESSVRARPTKIKVKKLAGLGAGLVGYRTSGVRGDPLGHDIEGSFYGYCIQNLAYALRIHFYVKHPSIKQQQEFDRIARSFRFHLTQ